METSYYLQTEFLIQHYLGLSEKEVECLDEQDFLDLAAKARFLEKRQVEAITQGVNQGVAALFGIGKK
ncbi:MAG: hypothetical protein QHH10_12095 [Peptococcaceae bacterium]|nr:hypothetical protein [Peptococcaceae bacterium]MDH7526045.1 hypothetical protein [Peptococcaceae bacterium]